MKTPGATPKGPRNVLDDFTGVSDLVKSPKTPVEDVPSTSKVGRSTKKRKASDDTPVSASKKTKVDEASTSRSGTRGSKSPSKTSRGQASPKMDIPKFSLDHIEETTKEKTEKSPAKSARATRAKRGAKKAAEQEAEAPKSVSPKKGKSKAVEQVPEAEEEISPMKPRRGRKAAAAAVTSTPVQPRGRKAKTAVSALSLPTLSSRATWPALTMSRVECPLTFVMRTVLGPLAARCRWNSCHRSLSRVRANGREGRVP